MRTPTTLTRPPRRAVTAAAVAVFGALVLLLAGCTAQTPGLLSSSPSPGYLSADETVREIPADQRDDPVTFTGTTDTGEQADSTAWAGSVVVVNFWYAACPPCRAEAPDLAAIYADYPDVHMLGINPRDDAGTAEAFERTFEVPFPSLWDRDAAGVAAMQGVVPLQAMPTTVVLDGEGRVAARILGQVNPTILRGLIDDVAAEA